LQREDRLLLDHRPALQGEVVARIGLERGRVQLHVFPFLRRVVRPSTARDGNLVARGAAHRVEERAETRLWRELSLENTSSPLELDELMEA
jgi:hypothetical protein